jgi:hypothetical protein
VKRMLTLTSLFVFVGFVGAQAPTQTPPSSPFGGSAMFGTQASRPSSTAKKSGLEAAIDLALLNNPDLRVADAKVREAEASMSRTRLQVLQKVVTAYQAIEEAKAAVKHAESGLARVKRLHSSGVGGTVEEVQQAEAAVAAAKSKEAAAQAELDYLQGKAATKKAAGFSQGRTTTSPIELMYSLHDPSTLVTTSFDPYGSNTLAAAAMYSVKLRPEGPAADRLRKALEAKMSAAWGGSPVREVLAELRKTSGIHIQAAEKGPAWDEKVTAKLESVPLSAVLQLLEDVLGDHRVIVRDYGLLITSKSQVPPGATTLAEFLRAGAKAAGDPTTTKPAGR